MEKITIKKALIAVLFKSGAATHSAAGKRLSIVCREGSA